MPELEDFQQQEIAFRDFITRLLSAQTYEFLTEDNLFSSDTLYRTLQKLCDIIADEVEAYSCTIHLKLYDPTELLSPLPDPTGQYLKSWDEALSSRIEKVFNAWKGLGADDKTRDEVRKLFKETRWKILASTQVFPYWRHPKGAAGLVATNGQRSPWYDFKTQKAVTPLDSGITTDIVQDNYAQLRDQSIMRFSRNLRKLGGSDHKVWKNTHWWNSFRNYYGSPIQIHSKGEVIGVLKVENKLYQDSAEEMAQDSAKSVEEKARDLAMALKENPLLGVPKEIVKVLNLNINALQHKNNGLTEFEKRVLDCANSQLLDCADPRRISLLALAYLAEDLSVDEELFKSGLKKLKDLAFIPYPREQEKASQNDSLIEKQWQHLKRCVKKHPAVEIVAQKRSDELVLREQFGKKRFEDVYGKMKEFYKVISQHFRQRLENYLDGTLTSDEQALSGKEGRPTSDDQELSGKLRKIVKGVGRCKVIAWYDSDNQQRQLAGGTVLSYFCFELTVEIPQPIVFYIYVPPAEKDFDTYRNQSPEVFEESGGSLLDIYQELSSLNRFDDICNKLENKYPGRGFTRNGEMIVTRNKNSAIDLMVDRWAARIHAFGRSLPTREFTKEDTHKLCWAALEIGKLVEREISYRANRSRNSIPLTAMEFFRIPISNLSFVDDLRARREQAEKVTSHIEHHIKNTLFTMRIHNAVEFKSRIKGCQSYLSRVGERHDGFVRANLAVWLYLLSLTNPQPKEMDNQEALAFKANLSKFRKRVKAAVKDNKGQAPTEDELESAGRFFKKFGAKLVGDSRFVTPPLFEFEEVFKVLKKEPINPVLKNLMREGFLPQKDKAPTRENFEQDFEDDFETLVFRQYDDYAIAAASLLCQLTNLELRVDEKSDYLNFYKVFFQLRNFLSSSAREIEDSPKFRQLRDVFGHPTDQGAWPELLEYIQKNDTSKFIEHVQQDQVQQNVSARPLYLNARGIYKRIRNLNHTLWHQRSVAQLEWDLRRFDLLGCQLNCLYKNQVFAAYEQLWNRGDPFFNVQADRSEPKPVPFLNFFRDKGLQARQQWLCLRTKHIEEDYFSLQIAALVDSNAIHQRHWQKPGFNLTRVRYLLDKLFEEFDADGANEYKRLAWARQHLRWEYADWFAMASDVIQKKSVGSDQNGFGTFLGEAVIDFLMEKLDELEVKGDDAAFNAFHDDLLKFRLPFKTIISKGAEYTGKILALFTGSKVDEPFQLEDACVGNLRVATSEFYELFIELLKKSGKTKQLRLLAEKELNYYKGLFSETINLVRSGSPLIFVDADDSKRLSLCWPRNAKSLSNSRQFYDFLAELRLKQKRYLFHLGKASRGANSGQTGNSTEKAQAHDSPGLCLRHADNVMHRIQKYVLLYDRDRHDKTNEEKENFRGWTSYDLFYYLRSLIPVEIQVRTALANTFAEQYHDAVYKGAPPEGTEFPRFRMEETATRLDNIDKELEIDFEDYITRYVRSKLKEQ